jgi:hypothetical protein
MTEADLGSVDCIYGGSIYGWALEIANKDKGLPSVVLPVHQVIQ